MNNLKGLFKLTDNLIKEIDRMSEGLVAQEESLKAVELDEQLCSEIERRLSESNLETENESVALENITKGPIPVNMCNDVFVPENRSIVYNKLPNPLERYLRMFKVHYWQTFWKRKSMDNPSVLFMKIC
ncbi:uncharacterized protein LOC124371493 [Homalodisca vitripennis]|uniref:uncharacterized protein LOC124371493 n=1 Tax=Homalodisca vitripennis TaxID=197043 RepID=UPI001EEA077E|nr:uncharacterized protein LOC124371493 [Homalodisca vitripennis]